MAFTALAFTYPQVTNEAKKYVADPANSLIKWEGKKVTGSHHGVIKLSDGNISYDGKNVTAGMIEIDMTTITCQDLEDKEYNTKFVGHMKNDDFFAVDKFPKAKFVVKSSKHKNDDWFDITGDLTIKSITKSVTFPATVKLAQKTLTTAGTITVDRTLYDIKYGSGSFFDDLGDKAIDNNFTIEFVVVGKTK